jgi:hypothetical protein
MPSNSYSIAYFPRIRIFSERIDHTGNLVAGRVRIDDTREESFFGHRVAVTDPACLNPDSHRAAGRLRRPFLDQFEASTGAINAYDFHRQPPSALEFIDDEPQLDWDLSVKQGRIEGDVSLE